MMRLIVLVLVNLILTSSGQQIANKLCVDFSAPDVCDQLARDQDIQCNLVKSKSDCIINADLNLPHVSSITAEEALIAAPLVSNNVVVIGEVINIHAPSETVVVVRNLVSGDFTSLGGLRYCHPGFRHNELISKYVLEELESKVVKIEDCSGDETIAEKKIKALAGFFGPSCRPGPWTQDSELDIKLKSTYSSLCQLCSNNSCDVAYRDPFAESLNCLNNGGDVALTTLRSAQSFFRKTKTSSNFRYLCPNGTLQNSSSPCVWTKQLPKLLITSKDSAVNMKSYIQTNIPSRTSTSLQLQSLNPSVKEQYLVVLLGIEKTERINLINATNLRSYVESFRKIPEANTFCGLTVRWSTKNDIEQQKCLWTRQAAINSGIQPTIECIQISKDDVIAQLLSLSNNESDLVYVNSSFGYLARKKGLVSIAYPETDNSRLSQILIVVRNSTNINSLKDLKDKNACFPEYAGKEWLAFIDTLRKQKLVEDSCDYDKIFESFVGNSCVPGAIDKEYGLSDDGYKKLCFNCLPVQNTQTAQYCNADAGNKFYGSDGALACVRDEGGYFAVITKNDLVSSYNSNEFKVLCKNGSLASYTGLDVDDDAYLTITVDGEVVVKSDSSKIPDAKLLLTEIEYYFGQKLPKPFRVFDRFNGTRNLLFPDSAPGLTFSWTNNKYVQNLADMLKASEDCVNEIGGSSAHSVIVPTILLVVVSLSIYVF